MLRRNDKMSYKPEFYEVVWNIGLDGKGEEEE